MDQWYERALEVNKLYEPSGRFKNLSAVKETDQIQPLKLGTTGASKQYTYKDGPDFEDAVRRAAERNTKRAAEPDRNFKLNSAQKRNNDAR